ncbi:hypothetical protein JZO86_09245 [Enterococcus ureasiticus]|uniref:pectate lyase-like adhesive domain-containing protein n=1 Tax=Enterococcus ureasiticus TaxID=903984 RepID=UPI001A8DFF0C|nr:pectate lyase-like adhesive domain-containing protein [Enterococcus ureasiticus]MBO0473884.1 hypothetical protein [Enterococcus ureasiticus]
MPTPISAQENTSSSSSLDSNLKSSTDEWLEMLPNDLDTVESSESEETITQSSLGNENSTVTDDVILDDNEISENGTRLEVTVRDWTSFVNAVRNESVTKITLSNSFENPKNTDTSLSNYSRINSLEIDGRNNMINFKSSSIQLGKPSAGIGTFHMHDIILDQNYGGANSEDIVGARLNTVNGKRWKYRFGNIITQPGVQRLARASHAEVTIYGYMYIDTRAENFYLGSLIMEDETVYTGNVNFYNFSIFWYNVKADADSTGASKEFTIGKNCTVNLSQSQTSGTTYPAIYSYYNTLTVGENSKFNVNMPGNAVRFDLKGSGMIVQKGAVVNLTSKQKSGAVIAYSEDDTYLIVNPGAYFYVIGVSTQPLINLSSNGTGTNSTRRQNTSLILNQPAQYDIRNLSDGATAVQVAMNNNSDNFFSINNSDIDLWRKEVNALGPSSETYTKVSNFSVQGNGTSERISSTTTGLNFFSQKNYRRISGMNQNPEIEWIPVTDADKTAKLRVIVGYVPDNNGSNSSGEVNYIPVYASKNQASVTVRDTLGNTQANLSTDANGYVYYKSDEFNIAGKDMEAEATRGPWVNEDVFRYTVIDVTPPEPAIINGGNTQSPSIKSLSGTGEPGSSVTITLNGENQSDVKAEVNDAGSFTIPLETLTLNKDDVIQIFLQDKSGKVTQITDPPKTNNSVGNIEPESEYAYRDAIFKAATKVLIAGTLDLSSVPQIFDFGLHQVSNVTQEYFPQTTGSLQISDTRGPDKDYWRVTLQELSPISGENNSLSGLFYYTNSSGTISIGAEKVIVEQRKLDDAEKVDISNEWNEQMGPKLVVPVEKQIIGNYQGKLAWTLEDVPSN